MNDRSHTNDQRYKGPLTTLEDLKKKAFMNEVRTNDLFQKFIREWGLALEKVEQERRMAKSG